MRKTTVPRLPTSSARRSLRSLRLAMLALITATLISCGGSGGEQQAAALDVSEGGAIEINDPSSPINGTKVVIEPGSLGEGKETFEIKFQDALPAPFPGSATAAGAVQASKVFNITRSGTADLALPASVTIPYVKATVGANEIPLVLNWDPASTRYSAVAVSAIDRDKGTVTFRTAHFSTFVVAVLKNVPDLLGVTEPAVDSGFRPGVDGFFQHNFGAYDSPGGSCLGMANYAVWYYTTKKAQDGDALYASYKEGNQQQDEDDQNARELISRAFIHSSQYWARQQLQQQAAAGEVFTGAYMVQAMIFTGDPQTLLMTGTDFGHAATVYAYDAGNQRFLVYDNNFPGEIVPLQWDPIAGFGAYGKYNGKAEHFAFDAWHTTFSAATFDSLYDGVENGWPASKFATVTLSEPAADAKGDLTVPQDTNNTIRGSVTQVAAGGASRYAHIYLNGLNRVGVVSVDAAGQFQFTIPQLSNPTGTDLVVLVSQSNKEWRYGFTAFFQSKLKVAGQFFFMNLGFETGDFSAWQGERHLWSGGTPVVPSDKSAIVSAGYDPIATDLPMLLFGSKAARVNNNDNGFHISSITQTAMVPAASNPVVKFSWAAVLEDPQHPPADQPYVDVSLTDLATGAVLYRQRFYSNDPSYSGWLSYRSGQWKAIPWQLVEIPVKGSVGHQIQLKVEAADCGQGAHGGYVYVDAEE